MFKLSLELVCVLAAFILINDNPKSISAKSIIDKREVTEYPTKYDDIDVDKIVSSKRLMQNYANCLLDKSSCTPEGTTLKMYLPDAIATRCSKCSEKQKKIVGTVLSHLGQFHTELFNELLDKYDPDGVIKAQYDGSDLDDEDEEN
ncbi:PREDICTED: ejaculatory bulb-specific protein 3-like [Nicrophorus vespilloides]|uniref:Ejaculatory bulb-specific protein 3-like n=1 Tax=Nicrophorus vespilloides TaxID=110193 RepID=A0ABM1MYJ8_NICVS|nr:PREDICTED: ejaculatory bulb-specific protein 3-like [Nicrophorus vespilloides]